MEKISFYKVPDMPGLEILSVVDCPRLWRWFHETYTICSIFRMVDNVWRYRARQYAAFQGYLMMMEPGETHVTEKMGSEATFQVLMLDPIFVERTAREAGLSSGLHLKNVNVSDPNLIQSFADFHLSINQNATLLEREARLAKCLALLMDQCGEMAPAPLKSPNCMALRTARDYIVENCSAKISLEKLSQVAGLSRFHLLRAFTQKFGLPPHAYQVHVRLARARSLLSTGMPIPQVEAEAGFCDQSHLTRHFKRAFGVTPGEYAASVRPCLVNVPNK
jgi:AraC-like DNA-binding protein